ncbi:MAG: TerC family protein [Deltaproteobacteria bacterium]|nr:TerC family protein [Deltaproteobacteria bacterium]
MFDAFAEPGAWVALLTLTALEIILGIDNIVFIAILTGRLPKEQQPLAYRLGLGAAMLSRLLLLSVISWVMGLDQELTNIYGLSLTGHSLVLLGGGLFLIGKSAHEVYENVEGDPEEQVSGWSKNLIGVVLQVMVLDVVFSLDSVVTAVGMADHLIVMMAAVIIAVGVMMLFAKRIGDFVNEHPAMKILALAFLLLIGVLLIAEGLGQHVSKATIYFAMTFALLIEFVNMRRQTNLERHAKKRAPVPKDD